MNNTPFDQEFLKKLDHLALTTRMAVKGGSGGNRKSRHKGSSIEFSDFREYVYGDDFRRIDWNAYARFERLFIKLFMEEQETTVTIFLDCSKSMDWGEPNKGILAKQLAAVLAYLALANFDRVALVAVNQGVWDYIPPFSGKQGFWKALKFIEGVPFQGKTSLSSSILAYNALGSRGGISLILSDLYSKDSYQEAFKYLQYKKQEVTLLHIMAPQEIDPPWTGSIRLVDSEGEEPRDLTLTPQVLKAYKRVVEGFLKDTKEFCYNRGIYYVPVASHLSVDRVIFDNLMKLGIVK